ncbi:MAG TPA: hypothetical protein PKD52_05475 [Clostridiales bacterium]|nr:hypothetical protein [Clostridiales bacterium]
MNAETDSKQLINDAVNRKEGNQRTKGITRKLALIWLFILSLAGVAAIIKEGSSLLIKATNSNWLSILIVAVLCIGLTIISIGKTGKQKTQH